MLDAQHHYDEAVRLLKEANETRVSEFKTTLTARAHVQATLALVATQVKP